MDAVLWRLVAALWVVWGAAHLATGALSLSGETVEMMRLIADAAPVERLAIDYPEAVSGVLAQHAWNLSWAGAATMVGGVFIWARSVVALWGAAMLGGLFDIGYFLFVDLAGHARFFPGTATTLVSSVAILLSAAICTRDPDDAGI